MEVANKSIEDILFEQKKITADNRSLVKLESVNTGKTPEDILREHNFVSTEDLVAAKGELLNIPFHNPNSKPITSEVLGLVPEPVARRYVLIPFELTNEGILSVAMADPLDLQVVEFVERKSGKRVKTFISSPTLINSAIADQYAQSLTSTVASAVEEAAPVEAKEELKDLDKVEDVIKEAPVAKIVSTLLEYAMKGRASDVHIEPLEEKTRVRYRIDGVLQERVVLPKKVHEALVSRIKILSNLKIDEKRVPQDGRFSFKVGDSAVDLRISTLPTVHGEKIVMRLLPKAGSAPTLAQLGLRGMGLKVLEDNIIRPNGIILITGPTGSGKTTTLFAGLSKINSPKVNIVTLEDPVEYQIPGVNQVQINPVAGLTFASGLRSFLRQDPNIIMVGEIRDSETAGLAIQAALTGHLVFSTLHTNSSAGALPRLLDMGAETFLLASSINAVVGQRVVRKICDHCREEYDAPELIIQNLKTVLGNLLNAKGLAAEEAKDIAELSGKKVKLYKGKGCNECGDSGYKGREGVFEVLNVTEKIGKLILERAPSIEIEKMAIADGMITMKQDGYLKAMEGVTTIEEVLRVAQDA
ncbi:MAG TPA: GspE/PulE family protein [Candidatus Saccharimonadales bacterium]|nr:GspE/PulE family protein [Candidatus Saccharimonadales bacterium]